MKIKNSTFYTAALYGALCGQLFIWLGLPLGLVTLCSIGTALIGVTNLLAFAFLVLEMRHEKQTAYDMLLLFLLMFCTVMGCMWTSGINYATIVKMLTFWQAPIYLILARKIEALSARNLIYSVNMCYPLMFGFFSVCDFAHRYTGKYGEAEHENLTLGYSNPNETAVYLMLCFFVLLSALFYYKGKKRKLLCIAELIMTGTLIVRTGSRAVILVSVGVVVFSLLFKKAHMRAALLRIVVLVPVFYAALLLRFPQLADLELLGESADNGRRLLYAAVMDELDAGSIAFGNFAKYSFGNTHNACVSVFATLGVGAVILFVWLLYRCIKNLCFKTVVHREGVVMVFALPALVFHSAVESAVLISGSSYAASVFLLAYLLVAEQKSDGEACAG